MAKKKKVGRPAKFVVRLTPEERILLEGMIRCGKGAARVLMKARILLKADVSENGPGWSISGFPRPWRPVTRRLSAPVASLSKKV